MEGFRILLLNTLSFVIYFVLRGLCPTTLTECKEVLKEERKMRTVTFERLLVNRKVGTINLILIFTGITNFEGTPN